MKLLFSSSFFISVQNIHSNPTNTLFEVENIQNNFLNISFITHSSENHPQIQQIHENVVFTDQNLFSESPFMNAWMSLELVFRKNNRKNKIQYHI